MTREVFISHVEASQNAFRRFLVALCCGDSQLADDIAQESYLKAYLSSDGLQDDAKFNAWIYRIGYNTFINHKRGEHFAVGCDEAAALSSDYAADDSFKYQALYAALDQLPDKERSSILLFYMQGYSVKEITAIVDATDSAVKQYLSRGRKHLQTLLSNN